MYLKSTVNAVGVEISVSEVDRVVADFSILKVVMVSEDMERCSYCRFIFFSLC